MIPIGGCLVRRLALQIRDRIVDHIEFSYTNVDMTQVLAR